MIKKFDRQFCKDMWLVLGSFFLFGAFVSLFDNNFTQFLIYLILGAGALVYRFFKYKDDIHRKDDFARNALLLIGWFFLISTIGNLIIRAWLGALICAILSFTTFYRMDRRYPRCKYNGKGYTKKM